MNLMIMNYDTVVGSPSPPPPPQVHLSPRSDVIPPLRCCSGAVLLAALRDAAAAMMRDDNALAIGRLGVHEARVRWIVPSFQTLVLI